MSESLPTLVLLIRDLGYGGAQRQLVTLARGLHGRRFVVTVVSFYGGPLAAELEAAGVPQIILGKRSRWDLAGFTLRLARALRCLRPALIHGYLAESNLMALLLKPFCGWPKVVWGVRDSESDARQWGLLGRASLRLNCLLSRFADAIIGNSESGRRWYQARGFPRDETRFVVVPNGIDVERFLPQPALAPDPGKTVFGIIGRLNPMKDHATFLDAAARVAQDHPDVRFEVIGDGPPAVLAELQARAKDLPVSWHAARADLENVYPRLSAVVSSSAFGEGFSNVLAEAMACGVPVIATDVGDASVVLGDIGLLCPPRDPEALLRRAEERAGARCRDAGVSRARPRRTRRAGRARPRACRRKLHRASSARAHRRGAGTRAACGAATGRPRRAHRSNLTSPRCPPRSPGFCSAPPDSAPAGPR